MCLENQHDFYMIWKFHAMWGILSMYNYDNLFSIYMCTWVHRSWSQKFSQKMEVAVGVLMTDNKSNKFAKYSLKHISLLFCRENLI